MKRLRKAKFYDGFMNRDTMVEIYVNPNKSEMDKIYNQTNWYTSKMYVTSDGTVYAWSGSYNHNDITAKMSSVYGPVDILYYKDGRAEIYLRPEIRGAEALCEVMNKAKSNLENAGIMPSTTITVDATIYHSMKDPRYNNMVTLDDIYKVNTSDATDTPLLDRLFRRKNK